MPASTFYPNEQKWCIAKIYRCIDKLTNIGSDNGLSPAPSHCLNQCRNIVNWTLGNKLQWFFLSEFKHFRSLKCIWKCLRNFVSTSICIYPRRQRPLSSSTKKCINLQRSNLCDSLLLCVDSCISRKYEKGCASQKLILVDFFWINANRYTFSKLSYGAGGLTPPTPTPHPHPPPPPPPPPPPHPPHPHPPTPIRIRTSCTAYCDLVRKGSKVPRI